MSYFLLCLELGDTSFVVLSSKIVGKKALLILSHLFKLCVVINFATRLFISGHTTRRWFNRGWLPVVIPLGGGWLPVVIPL